MKKITSFLIIISTILPFYKVGVNANLDLIVSPIKYEIDAQPGSSLTKTAKLINRGSETKTIYTGTSDFTTNDSSGSPTFIRKSELVNPDQELASRITIDTESFTIDSLEEVSISFTIDVPTDATPGGHYGAVFFKNFGSESSSGNGEVSINVDYGVLLLINVDGDIIDDATPGDTTIVASSSSGGGYSWSMYLDDNEDKTDDCPLGDFTSSNIDGKCIDLLGFEDAIEEVEEEILTNDDIDIIIDDDIDILTENDLTNTEVIFNDTEIDGGTNVTSSDSSSNNDTEIDGGTNVTSSDSSSDNDEVVDSSSYDENFTIEFGIPFQNDGNTHIKPEGTITLIDENGEQITGVGKEVIKNSGGAIIGEKIVDYIPINDTGGNVLPNSERIFNSEWKGFPYEDYDEDGKKVIKYWSPGEYYTKKNIEEKTFIYPWERVNEKLEQKKVKAIIEIAYENYYGEVIEFNSAEEFYVDYKTNYIGINPYFIVISFLSGGLFLFFFIIFRRRTRKKCEKCKKSIKKKMVVCPYCGAKQKNKKK